MVKYLGWDTETHLITPTNIAPKMVCYQLAGLPEDRPAIEAHVTAEGWVEGTDFLIRNWWVGERGVRFDGPGLGPHPRAGAVTQGWCILVPAEHAMSLHVWSLTAAASGNHRLVAHNAPYDWGVLCNQHPELLPYAYAAIEKKWSTDTRVREQLYCIATDNFVFDRRLMRARSRGKDEGGGFPLAELVEIHFGEDITDGKGSLKNLIAQEVPREQWPWRYRYDELDEVPLRQWPHEAVEYAMADSVQGLRVAVAQGETLLLPEGYVCKDGEYVNEFAQVAADWGLHLVTCTGAPLDPSQVEVFGENVEREAAKSVKVAIDNGWRKVNKCKVCAPGGRSNSGTGWYGEVPNLVRCPQCNGDPDYMPPRTRKPLADKDRGNSKARLEEWVTWAYGGEPPRNEPTEAMKEKGLPGSIKTDHDTLAFSGCEVLEKYSEGLAAEKLRNTYLKFLRTAAPLGTLHASFNVLVRSGRTSSYKPNQQNPPRVGGYRECFLAPEGQVFCSLDYSAQELATLAQVCINLFGSSSLADAINQGLDPHLWFALRLLKTDGISLTYEEAARARKDKNHPHHKAVKYWRQVAKVCNFGYPGGLGANTFVEYARGYGLNISPNESNEYRKAYFAQWPQVDRYINRYLRSLAHGVDRFAIKQHHTGRIRGGCTFTSAANTFFQGLAGDGTKCALWEVSKRQYTVPTSALWGTRTWNVIHDELLLQGPEATAHEWGYEAARIMVEAMERYTPNVKHTVEPALMRRWYKDADTVHDSSGRLVCWEPKEAE